MKILVALRQVPERGARVATLPGVAEGGAEDLQYATNEPDAYALEHALALRTAEGGEVIAVSVGPEWAESVLRDALARGADRAVHVRAEDLDALGVARILAAVFAREEADLLLAGLQSEDMGYGQTPVLAAGLLGLPHTTLALSLSLSDIGLSVVRELEEGWRQRVELPLPAVVSVQAGGIALSYASLMGIKRARTKELKTLDANTLGVVLSPVLQVESLRVPAHSKRTQRLEGTAEQMATQLVEKLRNEVHLL